MSTSSGLATIIEQAPEMEWLDDAACSTLDVSHIDLFFVSAGKSMSSDALALCEGCPSRRPCLEYAYEREIAGGYYGGISPAKRRSQTLAETLASIESSSTC
jgi:WhiB family redox-sensing transcriptional regulator